MPIKLYNFFHLNLAYSAIEEEDRLEVIKKSYWPLLNLARARQLPFSIEASGYTLEIIKKLDPNWIDELSSLIRNGICEFIGCGYAQVIGPLVPNEVTVQNLKIGNSICKNILGVNPKIALLNEQAYSAGMIELYKSAGFEAIIMEWNNPSRYNPSWSHEWRYLPQRAKGIGDEEIPLIWNKSIGFQKFQRYAHGDLELDEMLGYVRSHVTSSVRAFPLYGNDIEVFDYRPGRYMTEASLHPDGEWTRIHKLFDALDQDPDIQFIKTSEVLNLKNEPGANNLLNLCSAVQPIPVKKQDKYNIVRWAVTGRNDIDINTRCWNLYGSIVNDTAATTAHWKELCYLWSSDFRTHVTERRWKGYLDRLSSLERKLLKIKNNSKKINRIQSVSDNTNSVSPVKVHKNGRFLELTGSNLSVSLNCNRGLAIDSFIDKTICGQSLFGTLHHGFFDDISLGADYYSGHLTCDIPGQHKITDLQRVRPSIKYIDKSVVIEASILTSLGTINKSWTLNDNERRLTLCYELNWPKSWIGALRYGYLTLNWPAFERDQTYVAAQSGGKKREVFALASCKDISHGSMVSSLISANTCMSLTDGTLSFGDPRKEVTMQIDKMQQAAVGLLEMKTDGSKKLVRAILTASELDDTAKPRRLLKRNSKFSIVYSASMVK